MGTEVADTFVACAILFEDGARHLLYRMFKNVEAKILGKRMETNRKHGFQNFWGLYLLVCLLFKAIAAGLKCKMSPFCSMEDLFHWFRAGRKTAKDG